jgi:hypothetical protein
MRGWKRVLLTVGLALVGAACMASKQDLSKAVDRYNNALRWRDMNMAMNFVAASKRTVYFKNANTFFSRMRVTDYRVNHIEDSAPGKEDKCKVFVTIAYIDEHTATEREILAEQNWAYDSALRRWVISTEAPIEAAK